MNARGATVSCLEGDDFFGVDGLSVLPDVTKIDAQTNRVTLGEREDLLTQHATIADVRLRDLDWLAESPAIQARIRYKSPAVEAEIRILGEEAKGEEAQVTFRDNVWGVTPGQSLVMYKDNLVIGGGIIQ